MSPSRIVLLAAVACSCLPVAGAAAATKNGSFAGTLGIKVPAGAHATIRATDVTSGAIVAAKDLGRTGSFTLSLPPGPYVVRGVVIPRRGRVVSKAIAVSLKAGQRRRRAKLTAPRRRPAKPRAGVRFVTERGNLRLGTVAVGIHPFKTTATGDLGAFASGFHDLLTTDVITLVESRCKGHVAVREVARLKDVLREFDLGASPYADKSTFPQRDLIILDAAIRGTISAAGDVSITVTNDRTGKSLGSVSGKLGSDPFAAEERLAGQLVDQLCKLAETYEVTFDVTGIGRFATHDTAGTMRSVVLARRTGQEWVGSGVLQWQNVTFTSKTECSYINPVIPAIAWSVKLVEEGEGLRLTWTREVTDFVTVSIDCPPPAPGDPDPPPIPGQPGPSLLLTGPETFPVPIPGGSQPLSGIVSDGADGFFDSGTMTVKPIGITAPA
jgi:hypothetical protein